MDFRILGPLEVLDKGEALDLGGPKQRAVLACLLLHANEVVATDRLIEALWEEAPPETAHKALQGHISQLRKLLGNGRLETKAPGYLLRVEDEELDLARFQLLIEDGNPKEALGLWRGQPLSDFAFSGFAQAEIARLEELRLAAQEERIDADLAAGRNGALVGELEGLVREHPLRERLRGQLMLALHRSGRQAEALEAYQEARRALTEELGIEPGRELRELQQSVLNQDPALEIAFEKPAAEEPASPGEPPPAAQSVHEVRKTVTVVVADLSPTVDRLDAEALRHLTSRCFEDLAAIFERHGASVERSLGGTVTAVFGIPVIHEDDAFRALRAATEARQRVADLGEELELSWGARLTIRIGVGTGEVVTGAEPHAIGEPVSIALELQQTGEPGDILLDEATLRLGRDIADVARADGRIRLLEVHPSARHPSRLQSPMVGRERERRRLQDAFEQAVGDRSCQLFTILGLAGVGKSRLVEEFLGGLVDTARVTRGRCLPYGEGITYWPVIEVVKELVGLEDVDSPEVAKTKLVDALRDEQDAALVAERVAELIGVAEAGLRAEEGFAAVRALFETLARTQPLAVVFDDIHWGEATFLDLLEHLSEWTREAPVLFVCLARPELLDIRPGWGGGKVNSTSILLEPLSEAESAELVENLAGAELEQSARRRIVEAAEGNPLFVEEMLALALEEPAAEPAVPPTIQALLSARLDRLDQEDRSAIERAAVQGKVFYEDALAELASDELRASVPASLGSLQHKELIRPDRPSLGGRTYRFRHMLIRDAAYESIPKEGRSELHERYGRWLEQAAGDRVTEYEEIVGYHLEQAYRYRAELGPVDDAARDLARAAAERLGAAGQRAFVHSDAPAGVNLISRATDLLPPDDPLRVDLLPNVRAVQGITDLGWADRVLTEAVEAAATSGDRPLAAHALVQRGLLRLFTEADVTADELLETAHRAVAVFEELRDDLGLARAWRLVAQAHYLARRAGQSAEAAERALVHARRAGNRFEERQVVEWLVIALLLGPAPAAEASARCARLLEESAGDPPLEVQVLGALALLAAMQGVTAEAEDFLGRSRRKMDQLGEWIWLFSWYTAFILLLGPDPAAAESELIGRYDVLKEIGEKSHFSSLAALLAHSAYAQGHYADAERFARDCEETAQPYDVDSQIRYRATRGKLVARRGELEAGEKLAREAVALAERSDFLTAHGDALMDLASVLRLQRRAAEAAAAISNAVRLYEAKGNAVAATRARAFLEERAT